MPDKFEKLFDSISVYFLFSIFLLSAAVILYIIHVISDAFSLNITNRTWYDYFLLIAIVIFFVFLCLALTPLLLAHLRNFMRKQLRKYGEIIEKN